MGKAWPERQRRTNRLVRAAYGYLQSQSRLGPDTAHALCRLTWITKSYEDEHAAYIASTKLPALSVLLGTERFENLEEAANAIDISKPGGRELRRLIPQHNGFTNFYGTYRESSKVWMKANWSKVKPILEVVFQASNDKARLKAARAIDELPTIPSPSGQRNMVPWDLLAPLLFALDAEAKFPIANGSKHVKKVLKELGVPTASFSERVNALLGLIGKDGISDAADLDQLRDSLGLLTGSSGPRSRAASIRDERGRDLKLKDAGDYEILSASLTVKAKRKHNELTNRLMRYLKDHTLLEGEASGCRYDVLVKKYRNDHDLLIEAKSGTAMAEVRLAIGQLFDYHRQLPNRDKTKKALLLPEEPQQDVRELLAYVRIGLLYFDGSCLREEWHSDRT